MMRCEIKMKMGNKGFTLIELIIVVAIIALMSTLVVTGYSLVFSNEAKEAAYDFASLMSQCRVSTMSGEPEPRLELGYDTDEDVYYGAIYAKSGEDGAEEQIIREVLGDGDMDVVYVTTEGTSYTLGSDLSLNLSYYRETATLMPLEEGESEYVDEIRVSVGVQTLIIDLTHSTGYHEVRND